MVDSLPTRAPGFYGLALHTASPDLGLAIGNVGGGDRRAHVWELGRAMSTHLHSHLAEFLPPQRWSDLAFLAVARGPGGFTGTRMGVVTARTLAQQLEIPLFAISTLDAVAWASIQATPGLNAGSHLAVEMMARRGEVFGVIYTLAPDDLESHGLKAPEKPDTLKPDTLKLVTALPETVMSEEKWHHVLETWPTPHHRIQATDGLGWTTSALLDLAHQRWQRGDRPPWSDALPFYGQSPV